MLSSTVTIKYLHGGNVKGSVIEGSVEVFSAERGKGKGVEGREGRGGRRR